MKKPFGSQPFFEITLLEKPIAMMRPRLVSPSFGRLKASKSHVYNPQASQKEAHGWIFKEAMMTTRKNCTDNPLAVELIFSFKRTGSSPKHMTQRIDIDNICKYYLDAMQGDGIVYFNDSQIIQLSASKVFAAENSVKITIYEV